MGIRKRLEEHELLLSDFIDQIKMDDRDIKLLQKQLQTHDKTFQEINRNIKKLSNEDINHSEQRIKREFITHLGNEINLSWLKAYVEFLNLPPKYKDGRNKSVLGAPEKEIPKTAQDEVILALYKQLLEKQEKHSELENEINNIETNPNRNA